MFCPSPWVKVLCKELINFVIKYPSVLRSVAYRERLSHYLLFLVQSCLVLEQESQLIVFRGTSLLLLHLQVQGQVVSSPTTHHIHSDSVPQRSLVHTTEDCLECHQPLPETTPERSHPGRRCKWKRLEQKWFCYYSFTFIKKLTSPLLFVSIYFNV